MFLNKILTVKQKIVNWCSVDWDRPYYVAMFSLFPDRCLEDDLETS